MHNIYKIQIMTKELTNLKSHTSMWITQILWGLNPAITKIVFTAGLTPLFIYDCRMIGAALLFWIASFFTKRERVERSDMLHIFFASMLGIILNLGMFLYGVQLTSPVNASIISTISPILTMSLAALFLHEPITKKKSGGVIIGGLGAILLITNSAHASGISGNIIGDVLCILAQTCYSCYLVFYKGLTTKYSPMTLMKWMFTFSALSSLPFTYSEFANFNFGNIPDLAIYGICFIVIGPTFISYLLLPIGQKNLRPTIISSYNYIQPVVSTIVAISWGLDNFNLLKIASILLIFIGVFMVSRSKSRVQIESELAEKSKKMIN